MEKDMALGELAFFGQKQFPEGSDNQKHLQPLGNYALPFWKGPYAAYYSLHYIGQCTYVTRSVYEFHKHSPDELSCRLK